MTKTLKQKIAFIYIILVSIIGVVGLTSVLSIYSLSLSVNNLMTNNYKSIKAVKYMTDAIDSQNLSLINYIYSNNTNEVTTFYKKSYKFYEWHGIEATNITEKNEKIHVDKINTLYGKYMDHFSNLQSIRENNGTTYALNYYNSKIVPLTQEIIKELNSISSDNESAMFNAKNDLSSKTSKSMYIILLLSIVAVITGFFISIFFIDKILNPIYVLKENMKLVKEGDLNHQIPVMSNDEIGELASEFNNMTARLLEFEKSSKGRLMAEKNKSISIVNSISDPLLVLDTDYKIIFMNKSCESFFNISEERASGRHFIEIIRNNEIYDYITDVVNKEVDSDEQKIVRLNYSDEEYYFNIVVTAVKDKNANLNGAVVLFQDVTQLKHLEEIKGDFISTISHEFKTPLTSIMIGTSLVKDENIGPLNDKQMDILDTIQEDSERLAELVTNLLQLTKLESGNSIFNIQPCSIIGIIENSTKKFFDQASANEINLYYEADESLPKVMADAEKIVWVINNLISNSLKYTNAGDNISIRPYIKGNMMHIELKDTGIGIPPEYMDKIFDKFIQVEGSDNEFRGTGLGLAIAKEIIKAHNGDIWCESELDLGSIFTFTLPISDINN